MIKLIDRCALKNSFRFCKKRDAYLWKKDKRIEVKIVYYLTERTEDIRIGWHFWKNGLEYSSGYAVYYKGKISSKELNDWAKTVKQLMLKVIKENKKND